MRKRISLLLTALMLALTMSFGGATAAFAAPPEPPEGCVKERGQWVCTTVDEGKPHPKDKFTETTTTTTQGNLSNFSPEPQGVGTEEECSDTGSGKCPPGQFK